MMTLVLVGLVCGCRRAAIDEQPAAARFDILIYLVDTLRADHLGCYGYGRETSPRLDEFARDAVTFRNAYAPSSWTKSSTASLLTGLDPRKHGAMTRTQKMSDRITLLGEFLKPLGYHTAAFMTNPNTVALWGFDQGFDRFYDIQTATLTARADHVNTAVFAHMKDHPHRPFLYYVHTMDPHDPYDPPAPFDRMWPRSSTDVLNPAAFMDERPPQVLADLVAAYDGEVAFNDEHFGRLLDRLKADERYRESLIVFTSDHGEEFGEHGRLLHGHTLYEELVRVPLVVKLPGNRHAGTVVDARASLLDVVPTIQALLRRPIPAELDGADLLPLIAGKPPLDRPFYFDLDLERAGFQGQMFTAKGVRSGDFKYIRALAPESAEMLFDLAADPAEQRNLLAQEAETAAELAGLLAEFESLVAAGVHLRLLNAGDQTDRLLDGELRTAGRFVDLRRWQLEAGDEAALADDARSLRFRVRLHNHPHPRAEERLWVVDEDHLSVAVEPPDAEISFVRLTGEGFAEVPLYVGFEKRPVPSLPLRFTQTDPRFWTPDLTALLRRDGRQPLDLPGGCYLAIVQPGERLEADIDPALWQRLKALGYVR